MAEGFRDCQVQKCGSKWNGGNNVCKVELGVCVGVPLRRKVLISVPIKFRVPYCRVLGNFVI